MGLAAHLRLFHIVHLEIGMGEVHIFFDFIPQITDDEDEFRLCKDQGGW